MLEIYTEHNWYGKYILSVWDRIKEVVESANGKDALKKLNGSKVDMLITDLNMPEKGGIELAGKLRSSAGSELTPVIMITSENHEAIRKKVEDAGIETWILKPRIRKDLKKAGKKTHIGELILQWYKQPSTRPPEKGGFFIAPAAYHPLISHRPECFFAGQRLKL